MDYMSSATTLEIGSNSLEDTLAIARTLGRELAGGEVIELVSDLGGGKTSFVRGLAMGIESPDQVQSPTFTISRVYAGNEGLEIHHFDFHRLDDPGILSQQLSEVMMAPKAIVVVEWADIVRGIMPEEHLRISIDVTGENERLFRFEAFGNRYVELVESLKNSQE